MTYAQDLMRKTYISVEVNDTISSMLGKMKRAKQHHALVFDKNQYKGMISKRFLIDQRINPDKMKVGNVIKKRSKSKTNFFVPTLTLNTTIKDICKLMSTADVHALPVVEKKNVLGIVTCDDVANTIANEYKNIPAEELSSKPVQTITENCPIATAIQLLRKKAIDHLPVTDNDGKLIGVVSMIDILNNPTLWDLHKPRLPSAASHQKGKHAGYNVSEKTKTPQFPIKNWMNKTLCCTTPTTKISEAIKQMTNAGVSSIILLRLERPVGILTIKDILQDYSK